jgi:hypothetical protein
MPVDDDSRAMNEVANRVAEQFPDVDRDAIRRQVEQRLTSYDNAAVRDFVHVLVEHEVVEQLREVANGELVSAEGGEPIVRGRLRAASGSVLESGDDDELNLDA